MVLRPQEHILRLPKNCCPPISSSTIIYLNGYTCVLFERQSLQDTLTKLEMLNPIILFDPQVAIIQIDDQLLHQILDKIKTLSMN